jgi:hypothetical protein
MKPDTHSDAYLYGYADAINNDMNLQAFTKSKEYQQGYTDALHDTAFTVIDGETF